MTHRYWPQFGLRLASPGLTLRPMAEDDLITIADLLPDDVEQDPATTTYPIGDDRICRGIITHQHYWKSCGTWRPGAPPGGSASPCPLPGRSSASRNLRAAISPSWARPVPPRSWSPARGRGYGKQRHAVRPL